MEVYKGLLGIFSVENWRTTLYMSNIGPLPDFIRQMGGARYLLVFFGALIIVFTAPASHSIKNWHHPAWAVALGAMATLCLFNLSKATPFLYFQF